MKIKNCKLKIILLVFAFCILGQTNFAQAGAVINKAPVSLGLISGLVGYWTFDGPDVAGVLAYDRSSSYATGTLTNGPRRVVGRIGQALEFSGANACVNIGQQSSLMSLTSPISFSLWIRPNSLSSSGKILNLFPNDSNYKENVLITSNLLYMGGPTNKDVVNLAASGNPISRGEWNHIAYTRDDSSRSVYINGVRYATTTPDFFAGSSGFYIGAGGSTCTDSPYAGSIDDVRIYNRALSADEIKRLYKIGATFKINVPSNTGTLKDGLVGYWSFDGPDVAGVLAYDRSSSYATGTLTNGPVRKIGRIGQGLEFDGVNDYVDAGTNNILNFTGDFSISAWYKVDAITDAHILVGRANAGFSLSAGNAGYYLLTRNVSGQNWIYFQSAGTTAVSNAVFSTGIVTGQWRHVVGVRSGNLHTLYVDGIPQATDEDAFGDSSAPGATLFISKSFLNEFYVDGAIDDVRIYNRALSPDEIRRLYKIGATFKINVPSNTGTLKDGLVGYWSFDGPDMSGDLAYDRSGNNATGTLTNGPVRTVGRIGQALNFDGSDDFVSIGTALDISALPFTISAWVNPTDYNSWRTIFSKRDSFISTDMRFDLQLWVSTGQVTLIQELSSVQFVYVPPTKVWTHLTVVARSGATDLYVNGTLQETLGGFTLGTDAVALVRIGDSGGGDPFLGSIDEERLYNRALSPDEIKRLYNMGR